MFDDSVFGPDELRFRQEMEWLKAETKILSEEELIEIVYSKKKVNEICSMVTFDDGYRDNFDIAFPILSELKIPAIFFIPTRNLSERKVGWWDVVAYLVKHTSKKSFHFRNNDYIITKPDQLIKKFNKELKSCSPNQIDDYLLGLSNALALSLPSSNLQDHELMTWEQIKVLNDSGMTIGSHSHDHSILSRQDGVVLKSQLEKSVKILEDLLNKKINSIAYPVGGYNHFNEETKKVVKDIGLKLGFSYLTGVNQWDKVDPFDVKRMNIKSEWKNLEIPLAFPEIFLKCTNH